MPRKHPKKLGRKSIKIFPDSSWVISYLCPKDSHHRHVLSCYGALAPYRPTYFFSTVVIMETLTGLIKNGDTVNPAISKIQNFMKSLNKTKIERPIELNQVLEKYRQFAKARKITKLTTMDFYIATEAMLQKAKILTADKKMYQTVKKAYPEIYLISDKIKGIPSDLPRLIKDMLSNRSYEKRVSKSAVNKSAPTTKGT